MGEALRYSIVGEVESLVLKNNPVTYMRESVHFVSRSKGRSYHAVHESFRRR